MLSISILIFGCLLVSVLVPKYNILEKLILGFGVGFGIVNFIITINLVFSPINKLIIIVFCWIISLIIILKIPRTKKRNIINPCLLLKLNLNKYLISSLFILVTIIIEFVITFSLLVWPVNMWDAVALYDFRGRYFSQEHTLTDLASYSKPAQLKSGGLYYFSYPLLTSNLHAISYLDGINNPKWVYVVLNVGFIYLFYKFLRRSKINISVSGILTFLLASSYYFFKISIIEYSNVPYVYYFVLGVLYFYEWLSKRRKGLLILSLFLIIISTQVRNLESLYIFYVLGLIVSMLVIKKERLRLLLGIITVTISGQFWWKIITLMNKGFIYASEQDYISSSIMGGINNFSFIRVWEVVYYLARSFWAYKWIYALFFITLGFWGIKLLKKSVNTKEHVYFPFYILGMSVYFMLGTYLFSFVNTSWNQVDISVQRAMMPLTPLVLAYVGVGVFSDNNIKFIFGDATDKKNSSNNK
ncbi:hypothetical protein A3A76_03685 [Candidatus Woesebacteria bacterium RIFCSPLOWO2_01_FULL_39_23]|uniref:Glycosyltransferase RgtA/B/C/D-like domain-containing protein n=1 Tax=Candidatus Woesebacteria bacterium RIFCSPHIGHO2_01_FULL_40_22 TaxID=1802499 RepID=A0A1F7YM01_9BACT|nr:MAG: hypothetical protein A2141_00340 [Candidatus Woesebacteria bacterium RBG_16_40_11]OGM27555.1 MAG: hypothetical protein A2628_02085 [Candidatus Woesebacteria bacterium RIFCSPHIGHO2_01_FULL_40_22]OGM62729.1 MAG: hypothetical protein A3A76_03685 [Candidatus Woesebacteria bacterium RIFCSPLOWO2_01_FULL_39_23]